MPSEEASLEQFRELTLRGPLAQRDGLRRALIANAKDGLDALRKKGGANTPEGQRPSKASCASLNGARSFVGRATDGCRTCCSL